jgi:hypothetical protein
LISRWAPLSTGASTEALPCLGAERSMEFVEDHLTNHPYIYIPQNPAAFDCFWKIKLQETIYTQISTFLVFKYP